MVVVTPSSGTSTIYFSLNSSSVTSSSGSSSWSVTGTYNYEITIDCIIRSTGASGKMGVTGRVFVFSESGSGAPIYNLSSTDEKSINTTSDNVFDILIDHADTYKQWINVNSTIEIIRK
jgi:hypothetical protein